MSEFISSRHNEKIKFIDKLKKSSNRRKFATFIIEGFREVSRAHTQHFLRELMYCELYFTDSVLFQDFVKQIEISGVKVSQISPEVYKKISLRENGDGLIALGQERNTPRLDFLPRKDPLFIAVENIEKPSNFGAIVRTAESAGIDGIIVLDQSVEIFNPHVIRNSQGAIFFANIYQATTRELIQFSEKNDLSIFVTSPHAKKLYFEENFRSGGIILVGAENHGVSPFWMNQSRTIRIPQNGNSDSLNVSVAAAIVIYECVRQRSVIDPC